MNRSDRFWFRFSRDSARKYPRTTCAPYRHSIPVRCRVDARPVAAPRDAQPVGDLDDTAGGDEPLPAAITPEAGPNTIAKGAGPSSQKKSGARSLRKAVARATGMHGTFSGKPKSVGVPRRLFPEDDSDDGPPLRVPPEVAAPAPPVEEIDDW